MADKVTAKAQVKVTSGDIEETLIGLDKGWHRVLELPRPATLTFVGFVRADK